MSSWDCPHGSDVCFNPNWESMQKGARIAVVIDALTHTSGTMIGVTVPDAKQVRVLGRVDPQVRGCRRMTLFDAVLEQAGKVLDLHLDERSSVVAHGLRPTEDMFRCVELCAGIACSSLGLDLAGFRHVCSGEWRSPFVGLASGH